MKPYQEQQLQLESPPDQVYNKALSFSKTQLSSAKANVGKLDQNVIGIITSASNKFLMWH